MHFINKRIGITLAILLLVSTSSYSQKLNVKLRNRDYNIIYSGSYFISAVSDNREEVLDKEIIVSLGKGKRQTKLLSKPKLSDNVYNFLQEIFPKTDSASQPLQLNITKLNCSTNVWKNVLLVNAYTNMSLEFLDEKTNKIVFKKDYSELRKVPLVSGDTFEKNIEKILIESLNDFNKAVQ